MNKIIYEGKSKILYSTSNPLEVLMHYKDDATAYKGIKKAKIENKGIYNNHITNVIFKYLKNNGVENHFIKELNDSDTLCEKLDIIPIEVICRNCASGTMAKRLGLENGSNLPIVVHEMCYKNDDLGDPLINRDHAVALGLVTNDEINHIFKLTDRINDLLINLFKSINIKLVDFKLEFGRNHEGKIILADEISPDTARLWDIDTNAILDKDRFRKDLGHVREAYIEIYNRLRNLEI